MKILSFFIVLLLPCIIANAQSTLPLRADTVTVEKVGGNATLKIKNATRDSTGGVLYNIGGGVTAFKKSRKINDSMVVVGGDTIPISGTGGGGVDSLKYFYVDIAVGDSTTDATSAIQNAINRAKAAGGGKVKIPRGKYRTTSTIIIDTSNIIIEGSGGATQIWADGDYGDIFYFRPNIIPIPAPDYFKDIGVYNLSIQSTVDRTSGYAIRTNYSHSAIVQGVIIGKIETLADSGLVNFYNGISFENESNFVMSATQIYAWHTGVYVTSNLIGVPFFGTNAYDGLITGNCFILGDTTKWHESDGSIGLHVAGGTGGVQVEQSNISFYTYGIKLDRSGNGLDNNQFFLGHCFAADNCGSVGVFIDQNGLTYQLQMTGTWVAYNDHDLSASKKALVYIDSTNVNLETVISGGTYRSNLTGQGVYVGGGKVTITGAQFHDNAGTDIELGPDVVSATIAGNTMESGFVNNSSIIPNVWGTGNTANKNTFFVNSNTAFQGLSFGNLSAGSNNQSVLRIFNDGGAGNFIDYGTTGTNFGGYGALVANEAYMYNSAFAGFTFMSDNVNAPIKFALGGNAEKIRFTPAGKIGIGITNPIATVHAVGAGSSVTISGSDATSAIRMRVQNTSNNNTVSGSYDLENDDTKIVNFGLSSSTYSTNAVIGANSGFLYDDAPGGFALFLNNASSNFRITTGGSTERFRIASNGNVTIGTLDTDLTPPTTSGTTKMVIADAAGLLSTQTIPTGSQTWQQTLTTGSTLTGNNTVSNGTNQFDITGSRNFADGHTFGVTNTSGTNGVAIKGIAADGRGIWGEATTGAGVYGNATSGYGVFSLATTGNALYAQSSSGVAIEAVVQPTSTNTIVPTTTNTRASTGTPANGIGQSTDFYTQTTTANQLANQIISKWTDATNASRTSQFEIWGVNSGTLAQKFTVKGTGQLQGNAYGSGTFTGTPTYSAQWDASGNVIEGPLVASGTYTPTITNVTNVSASTAYQCQYLRVGNTVTVSGKIDIDPTATGAGELGISLPIASGVPNDYNAGGSANSGTSNNLHGAIRADTTNDRAALIFNLDATASTANSSWFFTFTYLIDNS